MKSYWTNRAISAIINRVNRHNLSDDEFRKLTKICEQEAKTTEFNEVTEDIVTTCFAQFNDLK